MGVPPTATPGGPGVRTSPAAVTGPTDAAGPMDGAGPMDKAGPLGPVDPVGAAVPGAVVRPSPATATATLLVGLVGLVACLVVLGTIAQGVRTQEVFALDTWATPFLHGIASPGLDLVMNALTTAGSSLVIIPLFVLAAVALLVNRRFGAALFLGVASGGALLLDASMKLFFQRPRPQLAYAQVLPDYSFPSGHTMNSVAFYVALALVAWAVFGPRPGKLALALAVLLALGVGVSRVYLGYHYLTDVGGGLLAGTAWLLVVGAAFRVRPALWRWGFVDRPVSPPSGPDHAGP